MRRRTSRVALGLAALLSAGLAPAARADTVVFSDATGTVVNAQLTVAGTSWNVDWYLPAAGASALMTLQHGFALGCGDYRDLGIDVMRQGLMVLCLNAPMSGGNPGLGAALGDAIADGTITSPAGPLPAAVVVGGHSAGGHFASAVGRRLADRGYAGLRGAVLFDPVASGGFTDNLLAIAGGGARPVLAITANGSSCNSFNNAYGALKALPNGYVGIQLTAFSSHLDPMDADFGVCLLAGTFCGCATSANRGYVREFGRTWARDVATGTVTAAYYPGGSRVRELTGGWFPKAKLIPTT